jgi:hypothetical protein
MEKLTVVLLAAIFVLLVRPHARRGLWLMLTIAVIFFGLAG